MTHRERLLLLALVVCVLPGCRSKSKHTEPGRVYEAKYGFSIIPPEGWTRADNPPAGDFLTYGGPIEGAFRVNLTVNVNPHTGTPKEALPGIEQQSATFFSAYELKDKGPLTIDGRDALFVSSAFDVPIARLENLQYAIFTGKKVYMITFTAPQSEFGKYRALFEKSGLSARVD